MTSAAVLNPTPRSSDRTDRTAAPAAPQLHAHLTDRQLSALATPFAFTPRRTERHRSSSSADLGAQQRLLPAGGAVPSGSSARPTRRPGYPRASRNSTNSPSALPAGLAAGRPAGSAGGGGHTDGRAGGLAGAWLARPGRGHRSALFPLRSAPGPAGAA